jgi:hypothetical protein
MSKESVEEGTDRVPKLLQLENGVPYNGLYKIALTDVMI